MRIKHPISIACVFSIFGLFASLTFAKTVIFFISNSANNTTRGDNWVSVIPYLSKIPVAGIYFGAFVGLVLFLFGYMRWWWFIPFILFSAAGQWAAYWTTIYSGFIWMECSFYNLSIALSGLTGGFVGSLLCFGLSCMISNEFKKIFISLIVAGALCGALLFICDFRIMGTAPSERFLEGLEIKQAIFIFIILWQVTVAAVMGYKLAQTQPD